MAWTTTTARATAPAPARAPYVAPTTVRVRPARPQPAAAVAPRATWFLSNAPAYFATHGIARIERVITDNAFAYRPGTGFAMAVARRGARQKFIRPHCPWTNGKVNRLNRTFATGWAYTRSWTSDIERAAALPRYSSTTP